MRSGRAGRRVTRNVELEAARDLLERPARACIGLSGPGGPVARPVAFVWESGRYLVRVDPGVDGPHVGDEVVLLVDEGLQLFELRAVYVRGTVAEAPPPAGAATGDRWVEVVPRKAVAWDYGQLRLVPDAT